MKKNIFEEVKALVSNNDEKFFIEDEGGNRSEITAGKVGKIVKVSSKNDLNKLVFDKERIGIEEIRSLEELDFNALKRDLIRAVYNNLTYKLKKESQRELKDMIQKYGLREVQQRNRNKNSENQ